MLDIDLMIITHKLNVNLKGQIYPKKKKIILQREKNEVIKTQVATLKETKIVREVDYPKWLSNVVQVKICMDHLECVWDSLI